VAHMKTDEIINFYLRFFVDNYVQDKQ